MPNLTPVSSFDPVPELETNTLALGGPGGPMNAPAQALLNRTQWLHDNAVAGGSGPYVAGSGTANAITAAYVPAVTALADGLKLRFTASAANTGPTTFAPNALAAQPVVGGAFAALQGGEIAANSEVEVVWNAALSAWVLIAQGGASPQVPDGTQSQHAASKGQVDALAASAAATYTHAADLADGTTTGKGAALVKVDGTFTLRGWIANLLTSAGAALVGWVQSGTGAIVRKIQDRLRDTLNAADFGVDASANDNQAALVAVITEATNRGGATVLLPPGVLKHSGQLPVSNSNVKLRGFGHSMTHDAGTATIATCGTCLKYTGASAVDQIVFASPTGATAQKQTGGGLEDLWLDGGGVATRNLVVRSWNSGEFRNLYCVNATTVGVQVDAQSAALAEANDAQRNVLERIYVDAGVSAHGFLLDGASGFGNASFNTFVQCSGRHKNGHMFVLANCDNNFLDTASGFRVAGGTGLTVELRGSNTSGLVARSNHFRGLSGNGGVTARGTTSYTYASLRNTITGYDTDNSSPTPTIEAGATLAWKRDDAYSFGEAFVQMIVGGTLAGAQNARSALGNESLRIHDGTQNAVRIGNGTQEWAIRIDGSGNLNILRIAGSGAFTVSNVAQANNMVLTAAAAAPSAGQVALGSTTATTVGAAGAASALPSAPLGYLNAYVGATPVKIPYYN